MNAARSLIGALALLITAPAGAHRLDEYLQATTFAIEKGRIHAEMRLAPGVAVFPIVFADIDRNGDGMASEAEQRSYAQRVLGDLSLSVDGIPLTLRLGSATFAPRELLEQGRGEIRISFEADVRGGAGTRRVAFENHHQSRIGVYLVNSLVPRDQVIRLGREQRAYDQSVYQLDYTDAAPPSALTLSFASWWGQWKWFDGALLAVIIGLALLGRRRTALGERRPVSSR